MRRTSDRNVPYIRAFFRTSDLDRDFDEELQSHVAMLTEDNVRRGMTREEARRAALIRVGGATSLRERHREARGLPAFDSLLQDLRFALRLLVKDRWFTTAVVVALALGVGVNTTVFTVINGWNLRDLPVDEPGRLMHLGTRDAQGRTRGVSYLDFLDWRDGSRTFTGGIGRPTRGRCGRDPRDRGYGERPERRVPLCAHRRWLTRWQRALRDQIDYAEFCRRGLARQS